jgi:4-diphosphocytidyl-2-C-methyl-D-erythritol kinase
VSVARAFAKINLGLVVGPRRADGKHELITVLQCVDLHDDLELEPADELTIEGFAADTIVRAALEELARASGTEPRWSVRIGKHIPVAAGLGGGSTDAAAALRLANAALPDPLPLERLQRIAATIGADVPFFLRGGAQLGTGDGTELEPAELPIDYEVVLVVPHGESKKSTAAVYDAFDARRGDEGFDSRAAALRRALASVVTATDLAALPSNDLVSSPLAEQLTSAGAFRADVTGAGPTVYGLFERLDDARAAAEALDAAGRTFVSRPVAR